MKATIPLQMRNNNTSTPPKTLAEEEKIAGPRGMIPSPLSTGEGGEILGAAVPEPPTRAQPHEGGCKRLIPGLHGCSGTVYGILGEQRFQDLQQELSHMKEAVKGRAPVSMDALVQ